MRSSSLKTTTWRTGLLAALMTTPLMAADAPAAIEVNAGDTSWVLTSTALVLLMCLPGLGMFYGGLVRSKNILSILVQGYVLAALMLLLWVGFGYSLAGSGSGFIGKFLGDFSNLGLSKVAIDTPSAANAGVPESLYVLFQATFIMITPGLLIGAFAERMRFKAAIVFSTLWMILSYIPMWHMAWGKGLFTDGSIGGEAIDFAGGTVVHINAGMAGLVACIVLGKRRGWPGPNLLPHNVPMVVLGASLLFVGWLGFNGGSAVGANSSAAWSCLTTVIAGCAGILAWSLVEYVLHKTPTAIGAATGLVAGLVAITPACNSTTLGGAVLIGAISAVVCFVCVTKLKHKFGFDDSLDVFGVHGVGGIVGCVLAGVLLRDGCGHPGQFWVQLWSALICMVWSGVAALLAIYLTKLITPLRVTSEVEYAGLNRNEHGEDAYNSEN